MPELIYMLRDPMIDLKEITAHLDALIAPERERQVVALGAPEQRRLWTVAGGSRPLDLTYLVPDGARPLTSFAFEGKNSLPVFKRFQKVFYRDSKGDLCGYNANPKLVQLTIGHGYFRVHMNPRDPEFEIQIDYTLIPDEKPPDWPKIKSNDIFPTKFVYGGTKDNLRWVSKDVVIGRAFKMGIEPMPNWFVLCRKGG